MAQQNGSPARAAGTIDVGGDLTVNRIGFGAMRILGHNSYGEPPSRDEARATVRRAVELGVNFIDTADSYGPDISEEILCEALYPYPEDLVIATKGGRYRTGPQGEQWPTNGRPSHLVDACEGSLRRLRLEQIPLYYLHKPDDAVPLEESVGALVGLKDQGKIRHIGLSNVTEDELRQAQRITPIVSIQNQYSVDERDSESLLDLCEIEKMIFVPYAPIRDLGDNPIVTDMARRYQVTPRQLVLAWLLARSPATLPIPGTGSVHHVEENVTAATVSLSPADVAALTEAF
jgi:aryl-alcohol dehydrogenase-like predicted oxidoreductase